MPLTRVKAAGVTNNAIGSSQLDLTANYAFTGNITGASDLVSLANTTISSSTSSVTASSSIINSTYDTYYVQFQFDSVSDGDQLHGRFLQDDSNVFGSNYQYELSAGGSSTYNGTNSDTHFEFDIGTNGNAAGEGPGGPHLPLLQQDLPLHARVPGAASATTLATQNRR